MKKESWVKIEYAQRANKPNELIIRELLSNILQVLLKEHGASQEQVNEILEKIYNY